MSASTTFCMDAVKANTSVIATNPDKKTIKVSGLAANLYITDATEVDYQEILGRTVTVWYNKNNEITKLSVNDETVVYGAFGLTVDTDKRVAYYTDYTTGEKYYTQDESVTNSTITTTTKATIGNAGYGNWYYDTGITASKSTKDRMDYAKFVLNSNGTIKTITTASWTGHYYVSDVTGNYIAYGTKKTAKLDLKDYTIVKNGKTISVADIKVGDIVFYNSTLKFADVYVATETGSIQALNNNQFRFNDYNYSCAAGSTDTLYRQDETAEIKADTEYMATLLASGKDITVYFDRYCDPVFVIGELGEEVS